MSERPRATRVIPAISGSIRGVRVINVPRALAARLRSSSLDVSASDLAKVRCNCGRNGFRSVGIFSKRLFRVNRMAALSSSACYTILGRVKHLTFNIHGPLRYDTD